MITDEEYIDALELIHDFNVQEYKKLPYEKGTLAKASTTWPARRLKKTGEVVLYIHNPMTNEDNIVSLNAKYWVRFKPYEPYEV